LKEDYQSLLKLPGVGKKLATSLDEIGFRSIEDIAKADEVDLASIKGISEKKAKELIQEAINYTQTVISDNEKASDEETEGLPGGVNG